MFDNPTDNHTDIEVPLYYKLRFTKLKKENDFEEWWQFLIIEITSKIIDLKFKTNLPGATDLIILILLLLF